MNRKWLVALLIAAGFALVLVGPFVAIFKDDTLPQPDAPPLDQASNAATRFLDGYVDPDGRVVRRDQDGDTVSEGQAYAMLVAVAISDRPRFDLTWSWAKHNLRQENGLFAWRWKDGRVVDRQSATDAELDMARALSLAATRFDEPTYADEAKTLALAIADHLVVDDAGGDPILVAGPWADTEPFYINPSYHSPRAEQALAELTGDSLWRDTAVRQRKIIDYLDGTPEEPKLVPDWATITSRGTINAVSPPASTAAPMYSWDAARTPLRLAESCNQADRDQAAQMWRVLNQSRQSKSSVGITLDGQVLDRRQTALGAAAGAAAAKAAGDAEQSAALLDVADRADANQPTYYGAAWAALGRIMLTTHWLGRC